MRVFILIYIPLLLFLSCSSSENTIIVPGNNIPKTTDQLLLFEKVVYDSRGIPVFQNQLTADKELPPQYVAVRYKNELPFEIFYICTSAQDENNPAYVLFQWDFYGFAVFVPIRYAAGQSRSYSAENGTSALQDGFVYRHTPPYGSYEPEDINPATVIAHALIEYDSYGRITRIMYRNHRGMAVSTTHFSYYLDQHRLRRVINVSLPEARNRIIYTD